MNGSERSRKGSDGPKERHRTSSSSNAAKFRCFSLKSVGDEPGTGAGSTAATGVAATTGSGTWSAHQYDGSDVQGEDEEDDDGSDVQGE